MGEFTVYLSGGDGNESIGVSSYSLPDGKNILYLNGNMASTFNQIITDGGGSLDMCLFGGTPETYKIFGAYDVTSFRDRKTLFYGTYSGTSSFTQSCICYGWGIELSGDFSEYFNFYSSFGTINVNFYYGSVPESSSVSTYYSSFSYMGQVTVVYLTTAVNTDHTVAEFIIPNFTGTTNNDNTTATFSFNYSTETYSVSYANFDGQDTHLFDNSYAGPSKYGHRQMTFTSLSVNGLNVANNNIASYSVVNYPDTITVDSVSFDSSNNHTVLYNSLFIGATYTSHGEIITRAPEIKGLNYLDNNFIYNFEKWRFI